MAPIGPRRDILLNQSDIEIVAIAPAPLRGEAGLPVAVDSSWLAGERWCRSGRRGGGARLVRPGRDGIWCGGRGWCVVLAACPAGTVYFSFMLVGANVHITPVA